MNPWATDEDIDGRLVDHVVDQIRAIMHGYPREIQGAICANLVAMWLAGHREADPKIPAPTVFRDKLLTDMLALIRDLVSYEDEYIAKQLASKKNPTINAYALPGK